jgi:hypothetical protein
MKGMKELINLREAREARAMVTDHRGFSHDPLNRFFAVYGASGDRKERGARNLRVAEEDRARRGNDISQEEKEVGQPGEQADHQVSS